MQIYVGNKYIKFIRVEQANGREIFSSLNDE